MATTIGLPSLTITFQAAAQQAANRSKKGYVGVFVRDAKAQGVHQLSSAALIPTELGQENQADPYARRSGEGKRTAFVTVTADDSLGNRQTASCRAEVSFVTVDQTKVLAEEIQTDREKLDD